MIGVRAMISSTADVHPECLKHHPGSVEFAGVLVELVLFDSGRDVGRVGRPLTITGAGVGVLLGTAVGLGSAVGLGTRVPVGVATGMGVGGWWGAWTAVWRAARVASLPAA